MHVADGSVTFQIKDHHATRESAGQGAKNYLRRYEVFTALQYGYQVSFEFSDQRSSTETLRCPVSRKS